MPKDISYSDKIDEAFVIELAKRGKVHLFSSQVSVEGESVDMKGVTIPQGVSIDWIGSTSNGSGRSVGSVTFRFPE